MQFANLVPGGGCHFAIAGSASRVYELECALCVYAGEGADEDRRRDGCDWLLGWMILAAGERWGEMA